MRIFLIITWVMFICGHTVTAQAASAIRWPAHEFKVVHDNPEEINLFDGEVDAAKDKIIETYLKDIGIHLQSKGFHAPMLGLTEDGKKYILHLSDLKNDSFGSTTYRIREGKKSGHILLNTPIIYGTNATELSPVAYQIIAHELFHAIQNNYALFGKTLKRKRTLGTWLMEGTANGFGYDMAFRFGPSSVMAKIDVKSKLFFPKARWGGRKYSTNLRRANHYSLPNSNAQEKSSKKMEGFTTYRTSSLWKHLDEFIATSKKPKSKGTTRKASYAYLADFFVNDLPTYDTDEEKELEWLDNNLRKHTDIGRPLADIFPEFITTLAHYVPDRTTGASNPYKSYNNDEEALTWRRTLFDNCKSVKLSSSQTSAKVELRFHKVSAACIDVTYAGNSPVVDIGIYLDSQDQRTINAIRRIGVQYKTPTKSIKLLPPVSNDKTGARSSATAPNISNKKITQWIFASVPFDKTAKTNTFIVSNAAKKISQSLDNETAMFRVAMSKSTGTSSTSSASE